MRIDHFYHVYADGQYEEPVTEHLTALNESGLWPVISLVGEMFVGFVGTADNCQQAEAFMRDQMDVFTTLTHATEGWEQVTLRYLQAFAPMQQADDPDGRLFYAHTKGASAALIEDEPHELNRQWRRSMTYDLMHRYHECLTALETHDAVGAHIIPAEYGGPYYGGNFWMARTDYILTLPPLSYESRYHAENWIGLNPDARLFDLRPGWPGLDTFAPERYQP